MEKRLRTDVSLLTPDGRVVVPMELVYDYGDDILNPKSEITLMYSAVEYKGNGVDILWTDTLADLQTKLPDGVKLACCMTCRHGNMCPYGTGKNQLFCTKDLVISRKMDMCDLFDQTDPREMDNREVTSFDYCEDFVYQSDDYYTYNDYLYQLETIANQKGK